MDYLELANWAGQTGGRSDEEISERRRFNAEVHALVPEPKVVEPLDYGASLDAAMTLVPDGWFTHLAMEDRHSHSWRWELRDGYGLDAAAWAATAPLALTAACHRALSQGAEQ